MALEITASQVSGPVLEGLKVLEQLTGSPKADWALSIGTETILLEEAKEALKQSRDPDWTNEPKRRLRLALGALKHMNIRVRWRRPRGTSLECLHWKYRYEKDWRVMDD